MKSRQHASPRSFGHTGYTGTSVWMDPERGLFVILLTTRVNPKTDIINPLPGGRGIPPIELLFNTSENHKIIAEAVQQMWRQQLNINARLVNQELKVYYDTRRQMNYQVIRSTWIGDYVDPTSFLGLWVTNGPNNETGWSNPAYDHFLAEAAQTNDRTARYQAFQRAEAILLEEAPILPVYFYTHAFLIRPSVQGWFPTILDHHPYKYVYLE